MSDEITIMYCPSCGEDVETYVMVDAGATIYHCVICGAELGGEQADELRPLEMMLVAEDSMIFREVLRDKVLELGIARNLELAGDGKEFLTFFTRMLAEKKPPTLAVLDIKMPIMNGINAANALRAVEEALGAGKKTPILFFSSLRCDDNLREVFSRCAPARYINKGASVSPEDLADRLVEVIAELMSDSAKK